MKTIAKSLAVAFLAQLLVVVFCEVAPAATFDPSQISGAMCLTADQAEKTIEAGASNGESGQRLLASDQRVQVANGASSQACANVPDSQSLAANNGSVPGPFVASLAAINKYGNTRLRK